MASSSKIDPSLAQVLAANGVANVVVTFNQSTQEVLDRVNGMTFPTRGDKTTYMKSELEKLAATSQRNVLELLKSRSPAVQFDSMWVSNQVIVKNASSDVVQSLANVPEVTLVRAEQVATIMQPSNAE